MVTFRMRDGSGKVSLRYISEDVDRHGNVRLYVRRPGQPKIRLHEQPGTEAFMAEYRAAIAGEVKPTAQRKVLARADKGSLRWLCEQYYGSADFKQLDERTRHVRRLILEGLCQEKDSKDRFLGDKPYAPLESRHIRAIRDKRADRPESANSVVKALRQVFSFAIEAGLHNSNPARDIRYLRSNNPDGHHTWTIEEVRQFEEKHPVGTTARLALALLLYLGQRRSDIVLFGRQHVRNGELTFTQVKGRSRKPVTLTLPILPELQRIIDATPTAQQHLTFLINELGNPFTANGFGNRFRKWCDAAGLPHCSAHGLRKATGTRLAELGATEHQIMAVLGHSTTKEANRYTRKARQAGLAKAGMALFGQEQKLDTTVPLSEGLEKGGAISVKKGRRING